MASDNVVLDENDHGAGTSAGNACYCDVVAATSSVLKCEVCANNFHLGCLKNGRPSNIRGDVFFDFTCATCSEDGGEKCVRRQMNWLQVVYLALYNLICNGSGRKGYFRWKDDICQYIEANWNTLNVDRKKTSSWRSTIAGILSSNGSKYFKNGQKLFKEGGWWTLQDVVPPAEKIDTTSGSTVPNRRRKKNDGSQASSKKTRTSERKKIKTEDVPETQTAVARDENPSMDDIDTFFFGTNTDLSDLDIGDVDPMENIFDDLADTNSNSSLVSNFADVNMGEHFAVALDDSSTRPEEPGVILLDPQQSTDTSQATVQTQDPAKPRKAADTTKSREIQPMSLNGEHRLLERLGNMHATDPVLRRLQRKLKLRQVKRNLGLSLFDIDSSVQNTLRTVSHYVIKNGELSSKLLDTVVDQPGSLLSQMAEATFTGSRVLDRFFTLPQPVSYKLDKPVSFLNRLVGNNSSVTSRAITSPYTSRVLKPFIRQDFETRPTKIKLLCEVCDRYKAKGVDSDWSPICLSSIDYCYVQPHHIPGVNALCRNFFWPGIDLSECLQYPDFSCVVLYKRLVIGCAFMVPDVKCNEAYISFIIVHPDWRRAGIGTFMIYHLIQTCLGKDVTLHVSVNNPAMVIYQRFGFKPERFIVNFYERYIANATPKEQHAFFLRLRR